MKGNQIIVIPFRRQFLPAERVVVDAPPQLHQLYVVPYQIYQIMKKILLNNYILIAAMALLFSCVTATAQDAPPVAGSITYQTFYDELSPYGNWIDYPGYGHVWSPNAESDFRPYATNGYWVYSNEGWAWASGYSWGWAPFHYGRWMYDDAYGWLWVPGYDWSPAWVTWGSVDNYYAWAPLMPDVNAGIQFSSWKPHPFYWNICDRTHIADRDIAHLLISQQQAAGIANHISILNSFNNTRVHHLFYAKGPSANEVEKFAHQKINAVSLREVKNINQVKHEGNEMSIYRPQVQQPQPRQFRRVDDNNRRPLNAADDKPVMEHTQQMQNVNRLPVHTAPGGVLGGGGPKRAYQRH